MNQAGDVSWPKGASTAASQPEMLGSLEMWGPGVFGKWRGFHEAENTRILWKMWHVDDWQLKVQKVSTFLTAAVVTMSDIFWAKTLSSYHMKNQYSHPRGVATNRRSIIFDVSWGVACIQVPQHQRNLSISKLPPKLCVIASKGGCDDESHGSYRSLITWTKAFWRLHPGKWTDET